MFEFPQFFNLNEIANYSPFVIFFVLFFGTFLSEDLACITAGALAGQGKITFALAFVACSAGIFFGDIGLYWVGRIFGKKLTKTRVFSYFVSDRSIEKASVWLDDNGASAIFLSRFMTGLRLPTYLAAGFLRTNFLKFALYFLAATAIWTPILIGATAFSGKIFSAGNLLLGIVLAFITVKVVLHFSRWKNRRLFFGRLKRILNWEFWPLSVFYSPVVFYILLLAAKHRSLTVFTCANPAIPASGFIGESKDEIYKGLHTSPAARPYLLHYTILKAENSNADNLQIAERFIDQNHLHFPLIIKPDAGERGKSVRVISSLSELEEQTETLEDDVILQEFFGGIEASVFYIRFPEVQNGKIFSITEKQFPSLTGDGRSTLETLILKDSRAVALAGKYFEENREKLDLVVPDGEEIQIIDIGTHSRGAIFADGKHLRTDALSNTIDEISRGFEGFYFGRYDIRARSFSDLKLGENFKIIELNGVTSESTNIYDEKFSLIDAYRILFKQWQIAFKIGAANQQKGVKPTKLFDLLRLVFGLKIEENSTI